MKHFYTITATLIAVLLACFMPKASQAQAIWNGTADVSWFDQSQHNFDIYTAEQLAGLAQIVNDNTYDFYGDTVNLMADIWLNDNGSTSNNWTPIGGSASATSEDGGNPRFFRGNFFGNGHTIYNMYVEKSSYYQAGLFGAIKLPSNTDGYITNLAMINPTVTSKGMMGAVVGFLGNGGTLHIENCIVINANITGTGGNNTGCFIGGTWPNQVNTYINSCGATGHLSGKYIGGFGGNADRSYYTNCYFAGTLSPDDNHHGGFTAHSGTLTNCYSFTNQTAEDGRDGTVVTEDEMKSAQMITTLGDAFMMDIGINNGYPIMSFMRGVRGDAFDICLGESVLLEAFGYSAYSWSTGETTDNITVSPTTNTTYTVIGTNIDGTADTNEILVTVHAQADVTAAIMASADGQTHGTVSPETASVACGSTGTVTFTVTPDVNYRVSRVTLNGEEVYGDIFGEGTQNITINPNGTLGEVKIYLSNTYTITTTTLLNTGEPLNLSNLVTPYSADGVYTVPAGSSLVYTFNNTARYALVDATIDNISAGVITSYEFNDIHDDHTIVATYMDDCGISALPFVEDFETTTASYSYSESSIPECFAINSNGSYPFNYSYSTTAHSGSGSMYTYNYNYGENSSQVPTLILPKLDTENIPVNSIMMKFYGYINSNDGEFVVGVMTDPNDISTFTRVQSVKPSTTSTFEELTVYFNNYEGEGEYIAIKNAVTAYCNLILDDITISEAPTCSSIENLTVHDVYGTNATLDWEPNIVGETTDYEITVTDADGNEYNEYTTDTHYTLLNLDEQTAYTVSVSAICGNETSDAMTVSFRTPCVNPLEIVNNSYPTSTYSTEGNHFPMSNHYLNSYTEQIYYPSDFDNTSAEFTGLSFQYNISTEITRTLDIYLAHTADSIFETAGVWATPLDEYVHVYHGPVAFNRNGVDRWVDIVLDEPFFYNGSDNLLLVVNDVTGSKYSNSEAKFYTIQTNINRSMCEYSDATTDNYSIENKPSTGRLHTQVDNIKLSACDDYDCIAPNTFSLSNITSSSVDIQWVNPNVSTDCEVEYRQIGDTDWIYAGSNIDELTINGLDPNTQYEIHVRATCSTDDDDWSSAITFRTECDDIEDMPYSQNFDNNSEVYGSGINAYLYCWDRYASDPSKTVHTYSTSAAHSAGNVLRFYDGSNANNIAIMPKVSESISLSELQISFWVRKTQASSQAIFELGVMTDKSDISTFEVLDTIPTGDWALVEYPMSNYTGDGHYIAFRVSNGDGQNSMRLDDIVLDYIPVCVHPVDLQVDEITDESVTIHWSEVGTASSWLIEYGPAGFTPGEGDFANATDTVTTIHGLSPNMMYDIYVQSNCGEGFVSPSISASFHTECADLVDLPYTQNFDVEVYGTGNDEYVYCWDRYASNSSKPTYVYQAASNHSSPNVLRFLDGSGAVNMAIMPKVSESINMNVLQISFWIRKMETSSPAIFEIGVMTDKNDISTFEVLDTVDAADWALVEYPLNQYTGAGHYIAFRVSNGSGNNAFRVDDVVLDYIPACPHPYNLQVTEVTDDEATINWSEVGSASSWSIEYGPQGFTPGEGDFLDANDTTATITGLLSNTNYDVYVASYCADGSTSTSISTSFRTECGPITELPYSEDFEDGIYTSDSQQDYIVCWNRYASDPAHYVYIPSSTTYSHSGSRYLDFHWTSSCFNIAIMPALEEDIDVSTLMVNFWACRTGSSGTLEVGIMTDDEDPTTFAPIDTINLSAYNTYAYAEQFVTFSNYEGTGRYIAFRVANATSCGYYIDDVVVDYAPDCSPVSNLEVDEITGSSAQLTWEAGHFGTAESYTLEYSVRDEDNWTTIDDIEGTTYLLGSLEPTTYYVVRVRMNCDNLTEGDWTTVTFRTNCLLGGDVQIGESTSSNTLLPSYSLYNYSLTEQIFTAEELGGHNTFHSISFQIQTANAPTRNWSIYLMPTSSTSLSSSFINLDATGQQVYNGDVTLSAGWNTINFDNDFEYDGNSNLLLIVDDNTGSWSSTNYFYTTNGASGCGRYVYNDGTNYDPTDVSGGTAVNYRSNVIFGGECDTTTTCIAPHISISAITSSGATINWVPGYQESAWEMEYRPLSDTNWISIGSVTTSPETITGLTPLTSYKVRMRSDCGGEYSYWTEADFTTDCGPITITEDTPWVEDFEGYSGNGQQPFVCWIRTVVDQSYNSPFVYCQYGESCHSGVNSAEFKGSSAMLALPEFTNDIHELRLSFWATSTDTSYGTLEVGVLTDANNPSSFELVGQTGRPGQRGSSSAGNGNFMGNFDFNGVTAQSGRIALRYTNTRSTESWNLDDFIVEIIPSCPSPVKNSVTATNLDGHTADISWVDNDPNHNSWTVYYKESNGTTWSTIVVTNVTTVHLTGLSALTSYDVYVITNCGTTEDNPDATNTITFSTTATCPPVSDIVSYNVTSSSADISWVSPSSISAWDVYYSTYEYDNPSTGSGVTLQATTTSQSLTNLVSNTRYYVWVRSYCDVDDQSVWTGPIDFKTACDAFNVPFFENFDSNSDWESPDCWKKFESPNITGYAYVYGTYSYSSPKSLKIGTQYGANYYGYIRLPEMNVNDISDLTVTFMAKRTNGSQHPLQICISNDANSVANITEVASFTNITSDWVEYSASLANYTGNGRYILIGVPSGYSESCDFWVDDINIDYTGGPGNCDVPTNLAANNVNETTADITWTAGGTETSWNLQYKTSTGDWSNDIVVTGTPAYTLSGLTPGTSYLVRVQAVCDINNTSVWSAPANFTTQSVVINDPTVTTGTATDITQTSATLRGTISNPDNVTITAQGFEWRVTLGGAYTSVNASGTNMTYNLNGLTANTGYTFRAFVTTANSTYYGDEVFFSTLPEGVEPCNAPTNLTTADITANSVTLDWSQVGTPDSWTVKYKKADDLSWTDASTTTHPYIITNLEAETQYEAYVMAVCDENESDTSNHVTFTTQPDGVNEYELSNTMLYPNPTTGMLTIRNEEVLISEVGVYDVYGKLLKSEKVDGNTAAIDLADLASGMYLVRIVSNEGAVITKSVVKR
ncbi:MAG: fibronectin type III domain-containing protein, partial [Bacteroidales bacterium]|nr:fibronectin type III domain-containing protein [Bacteroidales bacterium]